MVYLIDYPIGPEEIIHNLQGRDVAKPCKLVLDRGQEYGLNDANDMLLGGAVDGDVMS